MVQKIFNQDIKRPARVGNQAWQKRGGQQISTSVGGNGRGRAVGTSVRVGKVAGMLSRLYLNPNDGRK